MEEIDNVEKNTRRTNIRIYRIPEVTNEKTDDLAINFFKDELGVTVAINDISRYHCVGRKSPG